LAFIRFHACHTACLDISNGFVLIVNSSPRLIGLIKRLLLNMTTPSLHYHYNNFNTTTSCSAPVPSIGTQLLAGPLLEVLPLHPGDRFPCSNNEPDTGSRHLYAGCHSVSKQVTSELIPTFSQRWVLASSKIIFRHLINGSLLFVSIVSYLTHRVCLFSKRFQLNLLNLIVLEWFVIISCKTITEGLPPSHYQRVKKIKKIK
jgi:hypothetical protein